MVEFWFKTDHDTDISISAERYLCLLIYNFICFVIICFPLNGITIYERWCFTRQNMKLVTETKNTFKNNINGVSYTSPSPVLWSFLTFKSVSCVSVSRNVLRQSVNTNIYGTNKSGGSSPFKNKCFWKPRFHLKNILFVDFSGKSLTPGHSLFL